jgi:hypothetical protein
MAKAAFKNEPKENRMFSYIRLDKAHNSSSFPTRANTLDYLRDREINYFFPAEQIYRIKVDRDADETEYLRNLGLHYEKLFKGLIERFVKLSSKETMLAKLYRDVLYHLNFVKLLTTSVNETGQNNVAQSVLKRLADYVLDDTQRQPFIVTGEMGSGKSSLVATFFSNLFMQLSAGDKFAVNKHTVVLRFVGIDGETTYLRTLLKSLCAQLLYIKMGNYSIDSDSIEKLLPRKKSELKALFKQFLTEHFVCESGDGQQRQRGEPLKKLIIIIDSLQDLSRSDNSYKLDWLPRYLSQFCRLIITVSSESGELVQRLRRKYSNMNNYAHVGPLTKPQVEYLIRKTLAANKYRLEPAQLELLTKLTANKPVLPLHVKLLSENFLRWRSYTPLDECVANSTLSDAVGNMIGELEKDVGYLFVKHALSK